MGEHEHGLYAMPSLVDEQTLTISPTSNGPLLLEGPQNFQVPSEINLVTVTCTFILTLFVLINLHFSTFKHFYTILYNIHNITFTSKQSILINLETVTCTFYIQTFMWIVGLIVLQVKQMIAITIMKLSE